MAFTISTPNLIIKPITFVSEWYVNIDEVNDISFTPDIVGSFSVTKHIPMNQDVLDLNRLNDIFINNNKVNHIESNFNLVSINNNTREIAPIYEYILNKNITQNEIETTVPDCDEENTLQVYEVYEKYGKVFLTLKPIAEEIIIKTGKSNSYCNYKNLELSEDYVEFKDLYLNIHSTNEIGETCDCMIVNRFDKSNNSIESFDNVNISIKDFNLKSGSSYKNVKTLTGEIKDSKGELNFTSYTYKPHFNENMSDFYITCDSISDSTDGCLNVAQLFDGILFKNIDPTGLPTDGIYHFNPSLNKNFFKFVPAGIHRVGLREYYVDRDNNTIAVSYETKLSNNVDFCQQGNNDHIYKNMCRPLLIKKQIISNGIGGVSSSTTTILPVIAQSYKFKRDYILSSIKPHFKINGDTYSGDIAVYFGFLINGKLKENGIVHTEILQYRELVNGYSLPFPIYIPSNTEFFIGFSCKSSNRDEYCAIKYIENGQYDTTGNLVSFPVDVQTSMFDNGVRYENRMIKVDISVNSYKVETISTRYDDPNFYEAGIDYVPEYGSTVSVQTRPISMPINRLIFFNNDIIPINSNIEYFIGTPFIATTEFGFISPTTQYEWFALKTNDEFISKSSINNYRIKMDIQTFDKYQSPIIKPLEQNYLLKKYDDYITYKRVVLGDPFNWLSNNVISYKPVSFKGSTFKLRLTNLEGTYKSSTYDDYMKQAVFFNSKGNVDDVGFVIRLNFDYFQQSKDSESIIARIPIDIIAINKLTGKKYRCYTSNYSFKQDNNISNVLGVTFQEDPVQDGWTNKTVEIVPFLVNELTNKFIKIRKIEEWDFDIEFMMENENNNSTLIRNIKASVDSLLVDMNVASSELINPIMMPPIDVSQITKQSLYVLNPAVITNIVGGG